MTQQRPSEQQRLEIFAEEQLKDGDKVLFIGSAGEPGIVVRDWVDRLGWEIEGFPRRVSMSPQCCVSCSTPLSCQNCSERNTNRLPGRLEVTIAFSLERFKSAPIDSFDWILKIHRTNLDGSCGWGPVVIKSPSR